MDEIVQQVVQRTGLSEPQARKAVEAVVEQLRKRLPDPLGAQLSSFLSGSGDGMDVADIARGLFNR